MKYVTKIEGEKLSLLRKISDIITESKIKYKLLVSTRPLWTDEKFHLKVRSKLKNLLKP